MYCVSNSIRILFAGGMTKWFNVQLNANIIAAEMKYGYNIREKLTPLDSMAIISVLYAIFDVKKMTVINTNSALNVFA
jgi:hypothetical protein